MRVCEAAGKESRFYFMSGTLNQARKSIIKESSVKHQGLIKIFKLSEENEVDDIEANMSKTIFFVLFLKDLMKAAGTAKSRKVL